MKLWPPIQELNGRDVRLGRVWPMRLAYRIFDKDRYVYAWPGLNLFLRWRMDRLLSRRIAALDGEMRRRGLE